MRGGFTAEEGAAVSPASASSFCLVHRLGEILIHEIHHELVREPHVARGVLGSAIIAVAGTKAHNRWLGAKHVEKAEWRGIDRSFRIDRCDPGDGSRSDE
jgi:hypothetical protein